MTEPYYYRTEVEWTGQKRGELRSPMLPDIRIATPPEFNGHAGAWTPEHLFVSAVNSCFMTTFLAVAEMSKLEFTSFKSDAVGKLEKVEGQGYMITEVIICPRLTILHARDTDRAGRILEKAEKNCLVSKSVRSAVKIEPLIEVSAESEAEDVGALA
ncbi:MAG TPA: OsmC family protein [Pyrinomonadaceae bacterium]|nr:OsmC family protein [Pyrinomonadaceae bacterium]